MDTKQSIYAAHADYFAFSAARPRGAPLWKSIANDVAVHKRYKKRRGVSVGAADAYGHLRIIALARPAAALAPAVSTKNVDAPSAPPAPMLTPVGFAAAAVPLFDTMFIVIDVVLSNTPAELSQPATPVSA